MIKQLLPLALSTMLLVKPGMAAEDVPPPPPPPPLPEELEGDDKLPEPQVTIVHRQDAVIEEVRINGQLRYAKITPKKGRAYYMVDTDGDGLLDTRDNNLENPPINQWILLQW